MASLAPDWARLLTVDDEWVVRTALACVASDLEKVATETGNLKGTVVGGIAESARRYRQTLERIERA